MTSPAGPAPCPGFPPKRSASCARTGWCSATPVPAGTTVSSPLPSRPPGTPRPGHRPRPHPPQHGREPRPGPGWTVRGSTWTTPAVRGGASLSGARGRYASSSAKTSRGDVKWHQPPVDILAGAPDWLPHEQLRDLLLGCELGRVYWYENGTWARAPYPATLGDDGLDCGMSRFTDRDEVLSVIADEHHAAASAHDAEAPDLPRHRFRRAAAGPAGHGQGSGTRRAGPTVGAVRAGGRPRGRAVRPLGGAHRPDVRQVRAGRTCRGGSVPRCRWPGGRRTERVYRPRVLPGGESALTPVVVARR